MNNNFCQFKEVVKSDYDRYENRKGILRFLYRFFFYSEFRLLFIFRFLQFLGNSLLIKLLTIPLRWYYWNLRHKLLIDLPLSVKIGKGCHFPHGGPIVFNPSTVIGDNCTIHPCVLFGVVRGKGTPVVGDNCFIGNGAKILGDITLSDWSFVCPNSVVVKDISDGSVVSGIPSKVLNYNGKLNVELHLQ